jgi:hypothetical protein
VGRNGQGADVIWLAGKTIHDYIVGLGGRCLGL